MFRPTLEDARKLVSNQLDYQFSYEANKLNKTVKPPVYEPHPEPVVCNLVMKENGRIICTGRDIDEPSAFQKALESLEAIPVEQMHKTQLEMAAEIVQLRKAAAEAEADKLAKPTQRRAPAAAPVGG